jgi:hypothetical protein
MKDNHGKKHLMEPQMHKDERREESFKFAILSFEL